VAAKPTPVPPLFGVSLASWFRDIGYQNVRDDTNYYFCKGAKEIQAFDRDMRAMSACWSTTTFFTYRKTG